MTRVSLGILESWRKILEAWKGFQEMSWSPLSFVLELRNRENKGEARDH